MLAENRSLDRQVRTLERQIRRLAEREVVADISAQRNRRVAHRTKKDLEAQLAERERTLNELALARDRAEQATVAKTEFLRNTSHEIRTPMNGVLGMLELLEGTPLTPSQRDLLRTARSSAEAMLSVVNDVLDLSKIEAGEMSLEIVPFDPVELVESVCAVLGTSAWAKGVHVVVAASRRTPQRVRGDPTRFQQVVTNLVGNAVKFTEQGWVMVEVDWHRDELFIVIRDTGIGIAEDRRAEVFEPFRQADTSTTRRFGGTGLGLAICHHLATLQGGTLAVESQEGEGSTFTFRLLAPASKSTLHPPPLAGRPVFVDLDNPIEQFAMVAQIRRLGGSPVPIDPTAALPTLDRHPEAIVVTDQPASAQHPRAVPVVDSASGHDGVVLRPLRRWQIVRALSKALTLDAVASQISESGLLPDRGAHLILVAEDHPVNQKLLQLLLDRAGYQVEIVPDGQQAVHRVGRGDVSLVLMDCQMPVMSGFEATEEIRASHGPARHVPIIALTAHATAGDRQACEAVGMDGYLTKPIRQRTLLGELDRLLLHPTRMAG